jgi:ubiquinol-cytochrome c reductase cytochrome b subunit
VTGVLWPGIFIAAILLTPFIDRYKKFSWKDRPIITAFGITGLAQVMVTTYWGFYIPADTTIPLVQRLVIDPTFLYSVMILMVPLGFGFTYMMIKLAQESERKAKLAKEKGPNKVATINLSQKWINWVLVALLAFQVFLNIAAYNAALTGMKNISLFIVGLILIVFAALFHIYRYGMNEAKNAPPPPPVPIPDEKSKEIQQPQAAPEANKIAKGDAETDKPKAIAQEIPAPTTQANVGGAGNTNIGASDLNKT